MSYSTVSRLRLVHDTSQHTYLLESSMAQRLANRLAQDSDVASASLSEATEADVKRFQHWEPTSKKEDWLRVIKSQIHVKLVPAHDRDAAQPSETSLMMAIYSLGSENLLSEAGAAPTKTGVTTHRNKVFS